jgi:TRAP-type C4-dicarboxylate transport system permease small subunit
VEVKPTYMGTMISLATVAFGLIAAGAWNKVISDAIALLPISQGKGVLTELTYAVLVTILAIAVVQTLGKLAQKEVDYGPEAMLARMRGKKKDEESGPA